MSKVRIYGDTSGYVDIAVPAVAGTRTLNLDKVPQTATNGNTGIGTDNPSQNLHVSSSDHTRVLVTAGTDKYAELQFENDAQKFAIGVQNDDKFFLYNSTGTSQVLTVDTSSNVGFGTQSPSARLHVKSAGTGNVLYVESSDGHHLGGFYQESDTRAAFNVRGATGSVEVNLDPGGNSWFTGGNVGIGITAPTVDLHIKRADGTALVLESSNDQNNTGDRIAMEFRTDGAQGIAKIIGGKEGNYQGQTLRNGYLAFHTMNQNSYAEKMRIESTGDIRFGIANAALTAAEVHTFYNVSRGNNLGLYTQGADQHFSIDMWNHTGGSCNQVQFRGGGSGAVTGTITSTGNNATQYNTSSDYRLKENVDYTWDATSRLKQLKPVRFNWIDDDTNTLEDGFLAHEVDSVVPNAVFGEKDAVDSNGNPEMQGVDSSKLIPLNPTYSFRKHIT